MDAIFQTRLKALNKTDLKFEGFYSCKEPKVKIKSKAETGPPAVSARSGWPSNRPKVSLINTALKRWTVTRNH